MEKRKKCCGELRHVGGASFFLAISGREACGRSGLGMGILNNASRNKIRSMLLRWIVLSSGGWVFLERKNRKI